MKKKIFAGLGLLIAVFAIAFAAPSYEEQVQAKNAGYDWGYYSASARPSSSSGSAENAAKKRGYTPANGLMSYFIDGAAAGWTDKQNGKDYNNPYTVVTYIYNY